MDHIENFFSTLKWNIFIKICHRILNLLAVFIFFNKRLLLLLFTKIIFYFNISLLFKFKYLVIFLNDYYYYPFLNENITLQLLTTFSNPQMSKLSFFQVFLWSPKTSHPIRGESVQLNFKNVFLFQVLIWCTILFLRLYVGVELIAN